MLRFLADENFNNDIVRGLLRRNPGIDLVRVEDTALVGAADPVVLAWAATQGRVLLTHDAETMTHFAYERVRPGQAMPGVFEVNRRQPVSVIIDDLLVLAECSEEGEREGQVRYLPLR